MTSQRRLKELLTEVQEPFPSFRHRNHLQLKKPKQNASFSAHFCKNACLFSSASFRVDSPECRKSPLLSPAWGRKSPSRAMLLHVPAKTAALLLEAACRVQKTSSSAASIKPKPSGFGLLGSVIKRIANRTRSRKPQPPEPADDVVRWADSRRSGSSRREPVQNPDLIEDDRTRTGFTASRLSSVWSEENKSSSTSTSCSRSVSGNLSEENVTASLNQDFTFCLSPFRFALQKSPSPGRRSPACSPSRRKFEQVNFEEEEEEKEQCSPVSILDPPFGDDEEEGECYGDEDKLDIESSYAFVQRAKQQILQKLRKFEKLADLDPIELEKRMVEEEYGDDEDEEDLSESILVGIARKSGLLEDHLSSGMKRLISDLISEEEKSELLGERSESLVKRVCKRLESWKEVDPNTIEMMVTIDLKGENDMWQKRGEEVSHTAKMVEHSIFVSLLDEIVMG